MASRAIRSESSPRPRSKRKPRKPRAEPQYRRRDYEDGGGIDDDGKPNPIPEPELPIPVRTSLPPGPERVEVLRQRHTDKQALWNPRDESWAAPFDYVKALTVLGEFMRQVVLASRGLRPAANGVSMVKGSGGVPIWRAEVWDPHHVWSDRDHLHVGYAKTRGEARDLLIKWYKEKRGLDITVQPPAWLKEVLADAMQLQAALSDASGGMAWEQG